MTPEQERLWKLLLDQANYVGAGIAYMSDLFDLLAIIFAIYEQRGSPPEVMAASPAMKDKVARFLSGEFS